MTQYQFIFGKSNLDNGNIVQIEYLDDLEQEFEIQIGLDEHHCYLYRITEIGSEPKEVDVYDIIRLVAESEGDGLLVAGSVNSSEPRFQDWIDAVASVPESTISFINRGNRTVAFFTFPTAAYFQ